MGTRMVSGACHTAHPLNWYDWKFPVYLKPPASLSPLPVAARSIEDCIPEVAQQVLLTPEQPQGVQPLPRLKETTRLVSKKSQA